eukprot:TRINITY_DN63342_c0_g1_i1.p1 TRINITY_DN63342_c0_g1~~TRINITY_DN63342_c0_g1_i1.p1  ORF type:complete len:300 (+),score=55.82 TRINITY_DN63342_c0_g1_i1:31-930(+)
MDLTFLDAERAENNLTCFKLSIKGKVQMFVEGELVHPDIRELKFWHVDGTIRSEGEVICQFRPEEKAEKAWVLRAVAASAGIPWLGDAPPLVKHLQMKDEDTGDLIEFRTDEKGTTLSQFLNGELTNAEVGILEYSAADCTVADENEGMFRIRFDDRTEKSLLLRAMAVQAGVEWQGDEPKPLALYEARVRVGPLSIYKVFKRWDLDRSGTIQQDEFSQVLVDLGLKAEEAAICFNAADMNKNGVVDYAEFCAWLCGVSGKPPPEVRRSSLPPSSAAAEARIPKDDGCSDLHIYTPAMK